MVKFIKKGENLMKKVINLLGITLLCSSVLATASVSTIAVYAEGSETSASDVSESKQKLQTLYDRSLAALSTPEKYSQESFATFKSQMETTQSVLGQNLSDEDYDLHYGLLFTTIADLDLVEVPSSSSESSAPESSTSESSTSESSASESSAPESSTSESSAPESSTSESSAPESSTSESSAPESSTSESSTSEENTPSIEVSDRTMFVGDKLTEDDILGWASFKNAEGYTVGFEILGDAIQVTALGNLLVNVGTHTIRYYIEDTASAARMASSTLAEKTITLSVRPAAEKVVKDPGSPIVSAPVTPVADPVTPTAVNTTTTKPIGATKTAVNSLPKTGENNSATLIALGGLTLLAGAYMVNKKRMKD